jgi:hypothetical protein|tara:strand:+ start:519 stop:827 length:309 start_codon:yes stop_codon:yes gene_type:complete
MITDNTKKIFNNAGKETERFVREVISVFPKDQPHETLVADLSANDIKLITKAKKHGITDTSEVRGTVGAGFNKEAPPTDKEISGVIQGLITKPTGKFKKGNK